MVLLHGHLIKISHDPHPLSYHWSHPLVCLYRNHLSLWTLFFMVSRHWRVHPRSDPQSLLLAVGYLGWGVLLVGWSVVWCVNPVRPYASTRKTRGQRSLTSKCSTRARANRIDKKRVRREARPCSLRMTSMSSIGCLVSNL